MIKRKALSTIVGNVLVIMLVIIAAGIFLSVYLRSVRDIADRDLPLCTGIDLKMKWCVGFLSGYTLPNGQLLQGNGIYFLVERLPGGGEIRDLRFKMTDPEKRSRSERPVNVSTAGVSITTAYQQFVEYSAVEAALLPYNLYQSGIPCEVTVSAVVGDSNTICAATQEPIKCLLYPNLIPLCP